MAKSRKYQCDNELPPSRRQSSREACKHVRLHYYDYSSLEGGGLFRFPQMTAAPSIQSGMDAVVFDPENLLIICKNSHRFVHSSTK